MNREDYKIDVSSIDEKLMLSKTRQDWLNERQQLQTKISEKIQMQSIGIAKEIQIIQEQIEYIDEALERWYTDMCIRCGKLTEVETYCGIPNNCKHCVSDWVNRALSRLDDADLEKLDKHLTDIKEKGISPNGNKRID